MYVTFTPMDFKKYLAVGAHQIDQELDSILSDFLNNIKKTNVKLLPFAQGLLNSNKGGKRIRGVLCILGFELASSKRNKEIIKISSALEILHSALLIHDDIMDQSLIRRDKPSLYQALGGNHYGISQAISIGDIGFYLPLKIISESGFKADLKIKALSFLSDVVINTGWGQIMDMENGPKEKKDLEFIRIYKTAKYTIAGPMQFGAILAGARDNLITLLGQFGEKLGIAFQIQDDILDGEISQLDSEYNQALKYISEAKKMIPKITDKSETREILEQMTNYLIQRTK